MGTLTPATSTIPVHSVLQRTNTTAGDRRQSERRPRRAGFGEGIIASFPSVPPGRMLQPLKANEDYPEMEAEQLNSIANRLADIAQRSGELRRYL